MPPTFSNYEKLSEEVKRYPCLYDKQDKDFKKEDIKQRSWTIIASELNIEKSKTAETLLGNLKKLLSKRRTKLREVDVSGAAAGPVMKARKAVQELQYLTWLFPFVLQHQIFHWRMKRRERLTKTQSRWS